MIYISDPLHDWSPSSGNYTGFQLGGTFHLPRTEKLEGSGQ